MSNNNLMDDEEVKIFENDLRNSIIYSFIMIIGFLTIVFAIGYGIVYFFKNIFGS